MGDLAGTAVFSSQGRRIARTNSLLADCAAFETGTRLSSTETPNADVVPIKVSKRRPAALPWVAAAACALLALWLGVRLEQVKDLLHNQTASSAPAAVQQPAKPVPILVTPSEPQTSPPAPSRLNASQVRARTAQLADLEAQKDAALAQLNQVKNDLANSIDVRNSLQTQLASAQEQIHAGTTRCA